MLEKTSKNRFNLNFFPIKLILLLSLLVPYIISFDIEFNGNDIKDSYSASPKNTFKIKFSNIKNYVHIIVESTSSSNQILSYGTEETCTNNRQLLSMNPDPKENVELFLTKSQIESNSENNYLCVECADEGSCTFNLIMKSEESCQLDLGKQYNYYIYSEKNKNMTFTIKNNNNIGYVTVWVRGGYGSLNVALKGEEGELKIKRFDRGIIYSFQETRNNDLSYTVTIEDHVGNLVTIGSSLSTNSINTKTIYPNSLEVIGFLEKGFKKKECYNLTTRENANYSASDIFFASGLVFERYASVEYFINGEKLSNSSITDGYIKEVIFSNDLVNSTLTFCVTFHDEEEKYNNTELVYSFQLVDYKNKPTVPVHYPQTLGTIYSRFSLAQQLTFYSSEQASSTNDIHEITYNMKSIVGFPDMLFDICKTYPKCDYSNRAPSSLTNPRHINSMTTFTKYIYGKNTYTPISAIQPLILVNCTDGSQQKINNTKSDDKKPKSNFCAFETSIYTNEDFLTLKELNPFSQFIYKDEKDQYRIEYNSENHVSKIYLDLFIYTGDVNFTSFLIFSKESIESNITVHKYNLANKIFYSITVGSSKDKDIFLSIVAAKNSFYTISYQLIRSNEDFSVGTNIVESGASYLQSIDLTWDKKIKHIKLQNIKSTQGLPFLTNFYSLNCKFTVNRLSTGENGNPVNKSVLITDNYGQDIITDQELDYYNEYYEYTVEAVNNDASEYNKKLCMIYVSGVDIETTSTGMEREISVPENVPQQIVFEKNITKIKYAYHLADLEDSVIISFNLIDKAPYELNIYFGYYHYEQKFSFAKNSQFFITKNIYEKRCEPNEICTIIFEIVLNRTNESLEPKLETTIRQSKSGPAYLTKNELKRETLNGNYPRYFYTDIGPNEVGDVTVNYKRGSGKIYGKVVKRDQNYIDDNADWRGTYKFPNTIEESLRYDAYLKKLIIDPVSTHNCTDGCYLLITIESSVERLKQDSLVSQPFSIMTRIYNSSIKENQLPKVKFEINEYIIGNIGGSNNDTKITEFYDLRIPYDADYVIFDWQSDRASLFVNVGDERPSADKAHFSYKSEGHDTIFTLTKKEILEKEKVNSIKDIHLVIGIWVDKIDSYYTAIYAFKVHLAKANKLDIYHVRGDQKVLCKPEKMTDGKYRCLYAVIFDGIDIISSLSVIPRSQSSNAHVVSYAEFEDQEYFEKNDVEYLINKIPKNDSIYTSDTAGKPYIYVERALYSKSLFISVISNDDGIIELLSGISSLNLEVTPNPSTVQLFNTKNLLTLNFMTTKNLLINIVSVSGTGVVYWKGQGGFYYDLHGVDDRLSLASGSFNQSVDSYKLCFENTVPSNDTKDPGFLFYLTYYPRTEDYNLDQLKIGKSTEFEYRSANFPINFIVPLKNLKNEIHASLNFYGFEDDKSRQRWYNDGNMLTIWGKIISEDVALKTRISEHQKPEKKDHVEGNFDGGINVASLSFNKDDLKIYNNVKNPYLFFSVEKNPNVKFNFTKISAEVTVLQESGFVPATEKVYQYGKIFGDKNNAYILNINKNKPYMRLQFSANSDLINWCINTNESNTKENMTFANNSYEYEYYNGKSIFTFRIPENAEKELYLNIFSKDKNIKQNLGNYVFKYMNAPTKNDFVSYKLDNDSLKISSNIKNKKLADYTVKLKAVPNTQDCKISYILKGVYKKDFVENELSSTIAMTNSKKFTLQVDYPKIDERDNSTTIFLLDASAEIKYLQVIAKIQKQSINEFVAYESKSVSFKLEEKIDYLIPLIIVGCLCLAIIVGMTIIIFTYKKKNQDLMEKVNKISFAEENDAAKQENNLLLE